MAVLRQSPDDASRQAVVLADLLSSWRATLTSQQRVDLIDLGRLTVDEYMSMRDAADNRKSRNELTQQIRAWQLMLRLVRAPSATV
jgi:hypothetical protein